MTLQPFDPEVPGAYADIDFDVFHTATISGLIARHHGLVKEELSHLKSLSVVSASGRGYTYLADGGVLKVLEGTSGDIQVALTQDTFADFFHELLTISGLVATQRIELNRGEMQDLRRWEPTLRAIYSGRPIYSKAAFNRLHDVDGNPFDLNRTFDFRECGPRSGEMRDYLASVGYLHIRRVFAAGEINCIREHVLNAMRLSSPDDGKSWWSILAEGTEVPTRINYLNRFSDFFNQLANDPRVQFLGKLYDARHEVCLDRVDGPMVFIKSPNVRTGLANLLWHKDCDLGGHPLMCPLIQVGIQLDEASAANGQVKMLAGSHRYSNHVLEMGEEGDLPVVAITTAPGDVTLHFGDILHCTPEPTGSSANRKVLYYKFEKPEMFSSIPAGAHYNDLLFNANREGRIATRATTWKSSRQLDG